MTVKISIQSILSPGKAYLTYSWNSLTTKVSSLVNVLFSQIYAVYDFPRTTNPVTHRREFRWLPTYVEKAIGEIYYSTLLRESGGVVKETDIEPFATYSKLVHKIGRELTEKCPRKDLSFEFEVADNRKDNAWCLPGGKIAINYGLIRHMHQEKDTFGMREFSIEEKIAAVLSHEITHAAARHSGRTVELRCFLLSIFKVMELSARFFINRYYNNQIQQLEKQEHKTPLEETKIVELRQACDSTCNIIYHLFDFIAYRWLLPHLTLCTSRSHELEADKYGMHLVHTMGRSGSVEGFNETSAQASIWLQHYFQKTHPTPSGFLGRVINVFSTHPSSEERLTANKATWEQLRNYR